VSDQGEGGRDPREPRDFAVREARLDPARGREREHGRSGRFPVVTVSRALNFLVAPFSRATRALSSTGNEKRTARPETDLDSQLGSRLVGRIQSVNYSGLRRRKQKVVCETSCARQERPSGSPAEIAKTLRGPVAEQDSGKVAAALIVEIVEENRQNNFGTLEITWDLGGRNRKNLRKD
jgi:hypothetical protein